MQGNIKVFSGSGHPEFSRRVCEALGITLGQSRLVRFSNQNMLVQIEENVREDDVFVIQPSCPTSRTPAPTRKIGPASRSRRA